MGLELLAQYSPDEVIVTFAGIVIVGPFSEDSIIKIERQNDAWTMTDSAGGGGVWSFNPSKRTLLTLSLMEHSPSNGPLFDRHDLDVATKLGMGELLVKDLSSQLLGHAAAARIMKRPAVDKKKEASSVEWVFGTFAFDYSFRGAPYVNT